ncbi:hypothetical protein LV779_22495 [Streptomyces thinghirensis]|nr:hypothetical protein [Streptomyces thinghirensis]
MWSFTYDAAGREVSRRVGDESVLEQAYDSMGRLKRQGTRRRLARLARAGAYLHLPRGRVPHRQHRPAQRVPPLRRGCRGPSDGRARSRVD